MATISTLLSSAAAIVVATMASCPVMPKAVLAAEVTCPQTQNDISLKTVTLFDGPPSEHADLAPDSFHETKGVRRSDWDVAYIFKAGRRLYIQCDYGMTAPVLTLKPTASIKRCEFISQPGAKLRFRCGPT